MSRNALIVGINSYQHLPDLKAPALDAEAIAQRLEEDGDFDTLYRLPERITEGEAKKSLVSDTHPVTREQLEQALEQLFLPGSSQAPDTALFYFSGHGIPDQKGFDKGYLATSNTNPNQSRSGLSLRWLQWLLSESTVKQQIIWLDCCHSGSLLVKVEAANPGHGESKDRCFIASSRDFEQSWEDLNSSYSVLTKALLDGLDPNRLPGRWIDTFSLVDHVNQALKGELQTSVCNNLGEAINLTRSCQVPEKSTFNQITDLKNNFVYASKGLLSLQHTLTTGQHIERPELDVLLDRIKTSESSTTLILGVPGAGKTALMASLGNELNKQEYIVLAIKADQLNGEIKTTEDLKRDLHLDLNLSDAIQAVANEECIVLLIDQLDAISELLDHKSQRLNLLLALVQRLSGEKNIHIVATCREFEFRYGSQFSRLHGIDRLDLVLPEWDIVASILEMSGHIPNSMGEPLRELLLNPLHLNIFLEVAQPGEIFDSSQKLLDGLWKEKVTKQNDSEKCVDFLEMLAERMTQDEVLWLPEAIADTSQQICRVLKQTDLITENSQNGNIGFRHQTYYDHTLARSFARGTQSLTDIVVERQDGLFVRPILLRGLSYLRGTAPCKYHRQLINLIQSHQQHIRTHIRILVLEYLGAQSSPDSVEVELLIPLLQLESEGVKVLNVTTGSQGWFNRLHHHSNFTQWLEKPVEQARYCSSFLFVAASFAPEAVWELLENYWLDDHDYDALSIRILTNISQWKCQRVRYAEKIIQRSKIEWYYVSSIAEKICVDLPDKAPRVIRAHLDYLLSQAIGASEVTSPELPPDTDETEEYVHAYNYDKRKPLEQLLENNQSFYQIETFATANPKAFLDAIWPWFTEVVTRLSTSNNYNCTSYFDDHSISLGYRHGEITEALLTAITQFAQNDSHEYLKFVEGNQQSELVSVHRLLARGLEKVATQAPQNILDYLLGDNRRLSLGDSIVGHHYESKLLISSICPHLLPNERIKIEDAIYEYNYYLGNCSLQWRLDFLKENRQHRLKLLLSFPDNCLSLSGEKFKDEEIRAFPQVVEEAQHHIENDGNQLNEKDYLTGPRLTREELAKANPHNLLNLFNELNDETQWEHPNRNLGNNSRWYGGSIQQSREFGELVKDDHQLFMKLLPEFKPGQHERYVGIALVNLSKTNFSVKEIIQIIEELNLRGFDSEHYHEKAASALGTIAERNQGLPSSILALLKSWLSKHTQPKLEHHRSKEESNSNHYASICFSPRVHFLTGGRGAIVNALSVGFLKQDPPDLKNWAEFVRSQLNIEQHPAVWVDIFTKMPLLLNGDRVEATELFDQVIRNCPEILEYHWSIYNIGRVLGCFTPTETVQDWLNILQARNSTISQQAYGELLVLQYFYYQDEWSIGRIRDQLSSFDNEAILCGLAHIASHLWVKRRCREISTEILTTLASSNLLSVQHVVANIFRYRRDSFSLNNEMLKIIQAVCKNQKILIIAANDLISIIESENLVYNRPEIVAEVCKSFLDIGEELTNPASSSALIAKSLTSLVIQLHRQPLYRKDGLLLFEKLLDLNLREAQTALETLDRKPSHSN